MGGREGVGVRLRRIEGQVGGIRRMIEEEKAVDGILLQISAAQAALTKVASILLKDHIERSSLELLQESDAAERKRNLDKLMEVMERFGKSMR